MLCCVEDKTLRKALSDDVCGRVGFVLNRQQQDCWTFLKFTANALERHTSKMTRYLLVLQIK